MSTESVAAYLCLKYPHPQELSKTRITKLVYLSDWEHCLRNGKQITKIKWFFDHFGPYVTDVVDAATRRSDIFDVTTTRNFYGKEKLVVSIPPDKVNCALELVDCDLNKEINSTIDRVIDDTKSMNWDRFIAHVYSTKPIAEADRYAHLDLAAIAGRAQRRLTGK